MYWYHGLENLIAPQIPLGPRTTYQVGGPARYFSEPQDSPCLSRVLARASQEGIPTYLLGGGTNLLVSDEGVDGLVVHLPKELFGRVAREKNRVTVGAGHSLPGLVKWSVLQGMSGLECLAGVPGTVGAALRMNSGGKYGEIGERVHRVWGLSFRGEYFEYGREECKFVYRNSGLGDRIVTGCELILEEGSASSGFDQMRTVIREKSISQPLSRRSAGCVFKNPKQAGLPPAGKMIDDLGLKGTREGGAEVSRLHANFLVCKTGSRAADLLYLIRKIRGQVWRHWNVMLEMEIAVWGASRDALLPL